MIPTIFLSLALVFSGQPTIIDGDTIKIDNKTIRLACVDTPETKFYGKKQPCSDGETPCGEMATKHITKIIDAQDVNCRISNNDLYGRSVGVCYVKGEIMSINEQLLRDGYAYYYPCTEHKNWSSLETTAQTKKKGLFSKRIGGFDDPVIWRRVNSPRNK